MSSARSTKRSAAIRAAELALEAHRTLLRRAAAPWILAALVPGLPACSAGDPATADEAAGLTLRQVMYQIDFAYREVGTNIRNTGFYPRHRELLLSVADWVEQPAWESWVVREDFHGDPARFLAIQDTLRQGAAEARAAVEQEDIEGLRAGFVRMYSSCIACHKRYKPTY